MTVANRTEGTLEMSHPPETPPTIVREFDEHVCKICGCTDSRACITESGPCTWISKSDDGTGICSACFL